MLIGLGVLVLLLVAAAGWLAHLGLQAKNDLQAAKSDLSIARAALVSGDTSTADRAVAGAQANAAHAYANTRSPLWRAAGFVPWAGTSMRTAASLADAVHTMAQDVLPGLVAVRDELDPAKLRPVGGKIDVAALTAAAPTLGQLVVADRRGGVAGRGAADVRDALGAVPRGDRAAEPARADPQHPR